MPGLTFVGTGEAFDPDLPNTSVLYEGAKTLLLDCGYSVPHALFRITRDPSLLDGIFVSHWHADHTFGIPALLGWMRDAGRQRPLMVLGGPGTEPWLSQLLEQAYPGAFGASCPFPIQTRSLEPSTFVDLGPLRLKVAQSRHSPQNLAVRLEEGSTVVCYSGDGAPTSATKRLFDGATVLIHECYAVTEHRVGHAHVDELLDFQRTLGVETLCLVHVARDQKADLGRRVGNRRGVLIPNPGDRLYLGSTEIPLEGEVD
jgi:ribonuclease Z